MLTLLLTLGTGRSVNAEPLPLPNECSRALILLKDSKAPCSGLLTPPSQAAEATKAVTIDIPVLKIQLADMEEFYEQQLTRAHEQTSIAIQAVEKLQDTITKQVRPESSGVLSSPVFWGVTAGLVGVIVGGVVTAVVMRGSNG